MHTGVWCHGHIKMNVSECTAYVDEQSLPKDPKSGLRPRYPLYSLTDLTERGFHNLKSRSFELSTIYTCIYPTWL